MQQIFHGLSFSTLLLLVIIGSLIFIGFNIYRRWMLPILLSKDKGSAQHHGTFDKVEIVVWTVFVMVFIYYSLLSSLLVTVILLLLTVFAFYDFWKNYFAGIILRFSDKIQPGDSITVNDYSGKIIEFGNRALKMVSSGGEEILIPYQRINAAIKIGQKNVPKVLFKTFVLEGVVKDHAKAKQQLEKALFNNPWIIISKPVTIALEEQRASLSFHVLNNDFFDMAKERLLKDLGG